MTLSTTSARASASGNGATTSFAFSFKIWAAADLKVYLRDTTTLVDTLQTLTTDYTIDIVTYPNTGNVVFVTAPATGKTVVIIRDASTTQDLDLITNGTFAAENVETALDKIVAYVQALEEQTGRALLLPIGSALSALALPEPKASIAGSAIGINATGDGFAALAATVPSAGVSAFVATLLDDVAAVNFMTTLGALRGSAAVNFPSTATGRAGVGDVTITVTGAVAGDIVLPPSSSAVLAAGGSMYGVVTASNTVTVYYQNLTGGTVDPASMTVNVAVLPKSLFGL